ncbi:MAG TPA: hypothetical protein VMV93_10900, partial [Chloroflexota bacterium]|nr:hypothetical protein [Chloroflexota bacterium]
MANVLLGAAPLMPAALAANPAMIGSCSCTGDPTHAYHFRGTGVAARAVPSQSAVSSGFGYPGGGVDLTLTARFPLQCRRSSAPWVWPTAAMGEGGQPRGLQRR